MNAALLASLVLQQELAEKAMQAEKRSNVQEGVRQRQLALTNALRVSTVGELATGLAHELNQPLASISNLLEACAQYVRSGTADSAKLLELLADASSEAMRAAAIIAHLRAFIAKGAPQLETVDLRDVVGNIPHLLMHDLELARTELRVELSPQPLPVRADRTQIEQVLVNLIRNAIDAIDGAAGDERLVVLGARAVKGWAEVSVRDSGPGVPPELVEKMFKPFFTTKALGLGMGLALSRSFLEAHHGRIWMENPDDGRPGVLVRFAIRLQSSRARPRTPKA
jgi:two-component system sensor kinase FixL